MRLGTSGLGVIAVVSLLVTAAPERDGSKGNNERSRVDRSRTYGSERTSRTRHPWPSQVATETSSRSSSSSFVKIEFESRGSTSPGVSSHLSRPASLVPSLRHTDQRPEIPTALARFTTGFPAYRRALVQPRNFENVAVEPDVRSTNGNTGTKLEDNDSHEVYSNVPVSRSRNGAFEEKLVVALDSPFYRLIVDDSTLPSSLPRRRRSDERETTSQTRRTGIRDNYDHKRSTRGLDEATTLNGNGSSTVESSETMSRPRTATMETTSKTTTSTTEGRRLLDDNFRRATESYRVKTVRGTRESSRNKETTETNNGQTHFLNGQRESVAVLKFNGRTMSDEENYGAHSDIRDRANYSVPVGPTARSAMKNGDDDADVPKRRNESVEKSLTADSGNAKPNSHLTNEFVLVGKSLRQVDTAGRDDSPDGVEETVEHREPTMKSMVGVADRKPETVEYPSVTEKIARARQITSESSLEIPTIERPFPRSYEGMANTSGAVLPDNHGAARVRSFQTVRSEQQQQLQQQQQQRDQQQQQQRPRGLGSALVPPRLPNEIVVKDTDDFEDTIGATGFERPPIRVNQFAIPKTVSTVTKNISQPSINLVDGKAIKKYYEIKPSLITEMDRGTNVEATTTPRRMFDTFVLPSVPSAFGKFGPYFLNEEDRRNVTERIGNTVQLDCRIGLLGHRKVTWLQHYKDSFRLLTVERESYSVDRRISLNFQYPDNWRLQIAYASLRDSGLYKCQVEIDQDRSLVKRYNVIITAPTLTITDDSGRPVSGERHLKAGSALKLRCEARDVMQRLNESVLWMRGDETLTEDVSENRTTEIVNEKEITIVVSTLLVERATPRHAGNYSCVVSEKARTTIAVHVLNGELPAAVQHGSGVSTAVLNLWLIHLTASYGFFR